VIINLDVQKQVRNLFIKNLNSYDFNLDRNNFHNIRSIPPANTHPYSSYSQYGTGNNMMPSGGNTGGASASNNPDQQLLLQQMLNPNMMQAFLQAFQQQQQQQQQQHQQHQQQANKYDANNWATGMNDQATNAYSHHHQYPNGPTTSGKFNEFNNDPWGPQHHTYR
jgi:membrane protease subunit (stomatin/prohibitin family)